MKGKCFFCKEDKELTTHHILARNYNGSDDSDNLIPDICRDCHSTLENGMIKAKGLIGAGRDSEVSKELRVGKVTTTLQSGSILLSDTGLGIIDINSPFYGMRVHNKSVGERSLELALSGAEKSIVITGSPPSSWVIYTIAVPS